MILYLRSLAVGTSCHAAPVVRLKRKMWTLNYLFIYSIITHTVHNTSTNTYTTYTTNMDTCTTCNPNKTTYTTYNANMVTYNANMVTYTTYNAYMAVASGGARGAAAAPKTNWIIFF